MTAEASASVATSRIDYSLIATEQGWLLTAWEPALIEGTRRKPFLWKYTLEFGTLKEAHKTLQTILGEERSDLE
jgi:hypothetical protein